jgi:class 3 adenylate cyclase
LDAASVRVRMGLHSAEPYLDDDGYVGVGVSRAARICGAGHGGQILLSNATAGIVEDLGIEGVQLRDLGEYRLKDIERPQRIFQIVAGGLEEEFPPLKSLDSPAPSGVMTLLFSDVVGWHGVLRKLGDERRAAVARAYQHVATREVRRHGGRELRL